MTPEIVVHLNIIGNFDPKIFSETIGLEPSNTWRAGESVQNTLIVRKHDGWILSTTKTYSHHLDVEINKLVAILEPHRLQIIEFCKNYNLDIVFECVVYTKDEEFPSIHFDKKLLEKIRDLNANIDIDIY